MGAYFCHYAPMTASLNSLDLIKTLVGFDTTSAKSNLALIDFVAEYLAGLGATIRLTRNHGLTKANIFATIGPADVPGIVLSGHTDVVPARAEDWTADPFAADIRDDKIFGRGTADMKSFIAVALGLAPGFARADLQAPIHFAFSYDEEVGCLGVRGLIADLSDLAVKPALCIVGEPTEMGVIVGHKGKKSVTCTVHGKEGHSALNHKGVNAVEIAADLIAKIRAIQKRIRTDGPFEDGYDPPYTTVHTGLVQGGTALNIIPRECRFEFEIRNLPSHDPETIMAELRGHAQDLAPEMLAVDLAAGIMFDERNTTVGLSVGPDSEPAKLACHLSGHNHTAKVSFTTEAGLFAAAGIPAVVCGPGSIEQAHRPDEFITLDQVRQCERFLGNLLKRMS